MKIKLLSSLEKFMDSDSLQAKKGCSSATAMKNERFSFQLALSSAAKCGFYIKVDTDLEFRVSRVRQIPVRCPEELPGDDNHISKLPGLYPDFLEPCDLTKHFYINFGCAEAFWFFVESKGKVGKHEIKIELVDLDEKSIGKATFTLDVLDAELPEQTLTVTNWFHSDCLASYYNVEVFSERHWEIIENFISQAVNYGMNMFLTPVLTPPLDTAIGGERPTVQLVDIKVTNGVYRYSYAKLDRWLDICERCGVKYYEISHLFTQWGAKAAPKVMATVDGEYKRIFGWDTDSMGPEYKKFLRSFVKSLVNHLKKRGVDKRCYFHISDEPQTDEAIANYSKCRKIVQNILKDYVIMDALSHYEYYANGAVTFPVPSNDLIEPFLENKVPNLWTYYCTGQQIAVSNQFISMPSARNRIIATQLYKFNIAGFLQWGYNFYYSTLSQYPINPYVCSDADGRFQGGDPFKVYPSNDGKALESIRLVVFHEALQDLRAMQMLEKLAGREKVMEILEDGIEPLTFANYPHDADYILCMRERINAEIAKRVK